MQGSLYATILYATLRVSTAALIACRLSGRGGSMLTCTPNAAGCKLWPSAKQCFAAFASPVLCCTVSIALICIHVVGNCWKLSGRQSRVEGKAVPAVC